MKLGLLIRKMMEAELKEKFKDVNTFFILRYSKVSASDLNILRENLRKIDSRIFMTKNVLLKRLFLERVLTKNLIDLVSGNTAVVFVKEPLAVAKVLSDLMKNYTGIEFRGGIMGEKILDLDDFKILSSLPSLEFLKAKVLLQMKSPIISFTNTLRGVLNKLVFLLKAIKK